MKEKAIDRRVQKFNITLREVFLDLLKEKDYGEITIGELLSKAKYSRPTFYNHYSNKQEYVDSIMNDEINETVRFIKEFIESKKDDYNDETVIELNRMRFNHIYKERKMYKAFFTYPCFISFIDKYIAAIEKLHIPLELYNRVEKISEDYYHYMVLNTFIGTLRYWVIQDFKFAPEHISDLYSNTFIINKNSLTKKK